MFFVSFNILDKTRIQKKTGTNNLKTIILMSPPQRCLFFFGAKQTLRRISSSLGKGLRPLPRCSSGPAKCSRSRSRSRGRPNTCGVPQQKLPGELFVCFLIVKTSRVLPLNTFWDVWSISKHFPCEDFEKSS